MHPNATIINQFYEAFKRKDYATMQGLYHEEATFTDPVFQQLNAREVRAMWEMLIGAGRDLEISWQDVTAEAEGGRCRWDATYTFSRTGRKVHNIIRATFVFREGKIIQHTDVFDFWRWSRQALGVTGILLGWTGIIRNKVRRTARKGIDNFMSKAAE
jgi:ketosteroid isomerase-like protein